MTKTNLQIPSWQKAHPLVLALLLGLGSAAVLTVVGASHPHLAALRAVFFVSIWLGTAFGGRVGGFIVLVYATLANIWLDSKAGDVHTNQAVSILIWLAVFTLVMFAMAKFDDALDRTHRLAYQDALTGLYNRRGLEFEGRKLIQRAIRSLHPVSVAMIDCDHFKAINDQFGHRAGDNALRLLARVLKQNTRDADIVSRLGGDEFVVVFANTSLAEAQQAVTRIEHAFEEGVQRLGYPSSLSIGLAQMSKDVQNLRTLVAIADEAMYLRKQTKRTSPRAS